MNEENEQEEKSFTFVDKRRASIEDENIGEAPKPLADAENSVSTPDTVPQSSEEKDGEAGAPPIDFTTFIISLSSSALYHLGGFQDPVSGKTSINLALAKQSIDIIDVLKEKTTGNLDEGEKKLLDSILYDLKMKFVEVSKGNALK